MGAMKNLQIEELETEPVTEDGPDCDDTDRFEELSRWHSVPREDEGGI